MYINKSKVTDMPDIKTDLKAVQKDAQAALLAKVNGERSKLSKYMPWVTLVIGIAIGVLVGTHV